MYSVFLPNFVADSSNGFHYSSHYLFTNTNTFHIMSDMKLFSIPDSNGGGNGAGAFGNGVVPFMLGAAMNGGLGGFGGRGGGVCR